jgi:hypothetical protein
MLPQGRELYGMATMHFRSVRSELRRLGCKKLFKILMNQKESKCLLYGLCSLLFKYKGYTFCLSEVLGQRCEIENLKKLEKEINKCEEESLAEEEASLFDRARRSFCNLAQDTLTQGDG